MGLRADGVFARRIEDDQIRIAAHRNRSLAWIQPKQLCWSSRHELHKSIRAESSRSHASGINQAHAMLHSRPAVGNFREIVLAHLFLLFKTERTMIGGNNLKVIALQSIP